MTCCPRLAYLFFVTVPPPPDPSTLSLHDALPISTEISPDGISWAECGEVSSLPADGTMAVNRSEEHTSELQSRGHLVCRLLLEKKNNSHTIQGRLNMSC